VFFERGLYLFNLRVRIIVDDVQTVAKQCVRTECVPYLALHCKAVVKYRPRFIIENMFLLNIEFFLYSM
jgi:hypothetical protein